MSTAPDDLKGGKVIDKRLLRVDEAATLLNISRWTIYRWVHEGRIETTRLANGSLRIFHASALALIEQNLTGDPTPSRPSRKPPRR